MTPELSSGARVPTQATDAQVYGPAALQFQDHLVPQLRPLPWRSATLSQPHSRLQSRRGAVATSSPAGRQSLFQVPIERLFDDYQVLEAAQNDDLELLRQ